MARILVLEDDPDLRLLLRLVLERDGHVVVEAADGKQGLWALSSSPYDLVTLDNSMPEMTGLELLAEISRIRLHERPVIVMVSALASRSDIHASRLAGADAFIAKPFSPSELARQVRTLLKERTQASGADAATGAGHTTAASPDPGPSLNSSTAAVHSLVS